MIAAEAAGITPASAPRRGRRAWPALALLGAGAALLAWVGWSAWAPPHAPYRYQLVSEGPASAFADLQLPAGLDLRVAEYELRADGVAQPLAAAYVGRVAGEAPLLLEWDNRLVEPVLRLSAPLAEVRRLAEALREHADPAARVLAWPDAARRLALLAGVAAVPAHDPGQPLLLPDAWRGRDRAVVQAEAQFWSHPAAGAGEFDAFVDALLDTPASGAAALRRLAGATPAYVAVHVNDAYRLGALRPQALGIGYKDFPNTGRLHGMVSSVKAWLHEHGYTSYLVVPLSDTALRVYFLTDATSADTLAAHMLPFTSSNPMQLEDLRVVGNYGGFWVYEIPPAAAPQ